MKRIVFIATAAFIAMAGQAPGQTPAPALTDQAAARFLDQATWGPTPASISELKAMGIPAWLKAQYNLNTSDIPDQPVLTADGKPYRDLRRVQAAFIQNAVSGPDQLRQRVAFALSQIWVVSADAGVPDAYAYPPYWRIFRDNAFRNYRDIIKAVTLNPAMGRYLNMANNNKANPQKATAANENYAREMLQLFTLGLVQLNPDGSPVLDAQQRPVPTYDQTVVTNLAKALTGWTYPTAPGATPRTNNPAYYIGEMFAVQAHHDTSEKTILDGRILPAGQTAEQDLDMVIDDVMRQGTIAPFISQQLIQHLVTSNPSPRYIERVSNVFLDDGSGVRGDMAAVVAAILVDPEARAGDAGAIDPNFGHLREPLLFMANILRGLNATLTADSAIYNQTSQMDENPFHSPSVFSYFSPQYRTRTGLLGPEFQIYSTATAAARADIVNTILYGKLDKGTKIDLTPFLRFAGGNSALLDYIGYAFLHGYMSDDLRRAASAAANLSTTPLARTQAALYTVLTSGEYQVMH